MHFGSASNHYKNSNNSIKYLIIIFYIINLMHFGYPFYPRLPFLPQISTKALNYVYPLRECIIKLL